MVGARGFEPLPPCPELSCIQALTGSKFGFTAVSPFETVTDDKSIRRKRRNQVLPIQPMMWVLRGKEWKKLMATALMSEEKNKCPIKD
jgi:hypothetical protein